jgi:predicted branched-subunit amino acid permease
MSFSWIIFLFFLIQISLDTEQIIVNIFWNFFTFLGALGASKIGNPSVWGLDAAVPAAFCGLVWPRLKNKRQFIISGSAIGLALLLTPIAPAGVPIITTVLLAVIFGWKK